MSSQTELIKLHPYEYEHPFDTKALNLLQSIPGLDLVVRQFNKHAIERYITIQYTGSNIHITPENYPKIHKLLEIVCDTLYLPDKPDLYLEWGYNINGFTIGVDNPIIVLTSGAIDLLSENELLFLIGHEVGHIKSRHTLYQQMATYLPVITSIIGQYTLGIGKIVSTPLQLALSRWSRMSEFTADRAGLLACQDIESAAKVMMKWAGMPICHYDDMKLANFIDQAENFEQLDFDILNKAVKILSIMNSTHPWTIMRTAELLKWIKSGEYQQVLNRQTINLRYIKHEGDSKFCRKCNYRLIGTEQFCNSCGQKLK